MKMKLEIQLLNYETISDNLITLKLRHQSDYFLKVPPLYSYEYSNWFFHDINYALRIANDIINEFEMLTDS